MSADKPYWEVEEIDQRTATNEQLMTGLRTMWGVNTAALQLPFNRAQKEVLKHYAAKGSLEIREDHLVLTPQGRLLADRIASDLFFIDESNN